MDKKLLGNISNLLIQVLVVLGIGDTQCGFKAFIAMAVEKIFPKMRINRWGFDIEALALARKMNWFWLRAGNMISDKIAFIKFYRFCINMIE